LKHDNKDNTQATHQAKQAHITSSVLHMLLQQWWSPKGRVWMMKGHRTFEQGKIRKLLEKTTQIKNQGSKK
jgi:hypothetical protein